MKNITLGILAHVDAGKTTLSESMLYLSGAIRTLGRVDHQDTFLDTDLMERERGITIYSKQAELQFQNVHISFLDTPGHVDFSAETERTLQVLDYAILVVSGLDGVQSHTRTLFKLLEEYNVPTFIFVNKMDIARMSTLELQENLCEKLSTEAVDFTAVDESFYEAVATCDEALLDEYMESGIVSEENIAEAIAERKIFPVLYGSALKTEGVENLLKLIEKYSLEPTYADEFGAKVYKITRDKNNNRETWMKITGGILNVKDVILANGAYENEGEKVNEIRLYSGEKYTTLKGAKAGNIVCVTGLSDSYPGRGYGVETDSDLPVLEPVLSYKVMVPSELNPHTVYDNMKLLEEEDPLLHATWNERLQEITVELMGQIQLEVIRQKMQDRFSMQIDFGVGNIMYRETISEPTLGHGHYEPLKHFADVVLKMEPMEANSGIEVYTEVPVDVLGKNYQNQILNYVRRREHPGVLTGFPLTDMRITLVDGKSHKKHTEGGDFRRATNIAIRDGILRTRSVLLEPYYKVTLEIPQEYVGRALTDLERMHGIIDTPDIMSGNAIITGKVPVALVRDYAADVASYTGGLGHLMLEMAGYFPCHNSEEVIEKVGYNYVTDTSHPYESVYVHQEAPERIIGQNDYYNKPVEEIAAKSTQDTVTRQVGKKTKKDYNGYGGLEPELEAIFVREFGEIRRPRFNYKEQVVSSSENAAKAREEYLTKHPVEARKREKSSEEARRPRKKYLLVDGYNVIFAWKDLAELAKENLDGARGSLLDTLCNYQGFTGYEVIAVFDAYKVKGNRGEVSDYNGIHVVYTKEAQTADAYIAKATHEIRNTSNSDVTVVSSDGMVQLIVVGDGAARISSREFEQEVNRVTLTGIKDYKG